VLPRSIRVAVIVFLLALLSIIVKLTEIRVQAFEALLPMPPVLADPVGDVPEWCRAEPAWPPLRLTPLFDESGALEDLEVLRDRREAEVEWSSELGHRCLPLCEPGQDRPTSRVRQGREGGAQDVRLGLHFAPWLINLSE
jgi:hypothetical protein